MLDNITKEQRFKILENEFTYDYMYQRSMDLSWHAGANIKGYLDNIRDMGKGKIDNSINIEEKLFPKLSKELQIVLQKMCNQVGADPEKINFKEDGWFHQFTWTQTEEDAFTDWLAGELYNNTRMLKQIAFIPIKTKTHCRKIAEAFVWNYGWKIN